MRRRKKKVNYFKVFIAIILFIGLLALCCFILGKIDNNKEPKSILMTNIINKNIKDVDSLVKEYNLDINISYEYNDTIDKDTVISQSIDEGTKIKFGDKLDVIVSLGKLDKEKLKKDGINELGKVPIMMYHGIINMKSSDTGHTGGNVDVDGYSRTVEAFRNDLELFYKKGYRMIKLSDYVKGNINTEYGYSPIVLTFDDGNANNLQVTGLDDKGNIIIDKNSAVGVLEEFKKKYPDYNVTAIFFVTDALFNQPEYNEKILHWLVDNGYEVGNHTKDHNNLGNVSADKAQEVIGYMYNKLDGILEEKQTKIIALPYGSPYNRNHANYKYIVSGTYSGKAYETLAALRVGWEPEVSPFNKEFDKSFIKRCRAYDNNGQEFDIEMILGMLNTTRYISDGNSKRIVTSSSNSSIINSSIDKEIIYY